MTTQPPQVGPLSAMVQELLDTPGVSTRTLAAATYDKTLDREILNKDFWSRMARGLIPKAPLADELEAMARAMRKLPVHVQEAAAAQYLNYVPVHLSGYSDDMRSSGGCGCGWRRHVRTSRQIHPQVITPDTLLRS